MANPTPTPRSAADGLAAWVLTVLFLVAAALLFAGIYFALPGVFHYYALLTIGILSLFLALGSYLAEAFSREPTAQRAMAWAFFAMGFAVLLFTIALGPTYGVLSTVGMLMALVVVIVALIVAIALITWRVRSVRATEAREAPREAWRQTSPPSALTYAAANSPSVPQVTPPPSNEPPPRSP